ncbi:MAG: ribosome biogenesis GTPase Der [Oscillospiraceae bacterium]|jgi:GTP-binding protein|nr:ribosome biogenesis GTPase Der [Oscillospiraceae bacterium]
MALAAIVGRPNVGKSTLFNKLTGKRTSIVDDAPGITRDRIYGKTDWLGREFMLVDTGGTEDSKDEIMSEMRTQAQLAIDTADVIVFVTDIKSGVTAGDSEVAVILQKSGKPVVLCVNKCDNTGENPPELYEFYNLGLGEPFPVSSVHGHGTGDLLDEVVKFLPDVDGTPADDDIPHIAIIGKPNAGKSSLVNKIAGTNRVIVSKIAGTTRDAIDTPVEFKGEKYILIDTAGLRRKSKIRSGENVEKYSALRAFMAVDRADVCVMMIDAEEGFTEQDSKVAGYAHDKGKASVIAVNKWDLIEKNDKTMKQFTEKLEKDFSFMKYAPFVFISAKTGQRTDKLFELIKYTSEQNARRSSTGLLNDMLAIATARVQPPTDKGKRLKLFYITQASVKPPTFVVFCNKLDLFHFSYQRYIENQIRETFSMDGTPIVIIPRERGE